MSRRSAIDALHRSLLSLRANWPLVIVQWLQGLAVSVLFLFGCLPILLAVGYETVRGLFSTRFADATPDEVLEQMTAQLSGAWVSLLLAFLVASCVWAVAMLVHAYFQGGIYGVLALGERRAESGTSVSWRSFRAFDLGSFKSAAERLMWRFFWLLNLFLLLIPLLLVLFLAMVGGAAWLAGQASQAAATGIGCLGILALIALSLTTFLWWMLAAAELGRGESGVWEASARGVQLLTRRFPGVLLLALLLWVVGMAIGLVFVSVSMVAEFALREHLFVYISTHLVLIVLQILVSGAANIIFAGSFVSLVTGEAQNEEYA